MLSLRMPHAPSRRPDCLVSHSWRRNPLLPRHGALPNRGARVAVARQWTVRAQAPPSRSPPPAGAGANKGLAEGWHRTRGAAVGAAVVLACALGAACLKPGRANRLAEARACQPSSTNKVVDSNEKQGGGGNPNVGAGMPGELPPLLVKSLEGTSAIFGSKPAVAMEFELLELILRQVGNQDLFGSKGSANSDMLPLLLEHLANQVALLGDYENAKKILKRCAEDAPSLDARPELFKAIIETMLAVQKKLNPETTKDVNMTEAMKEVGGLWQEYENASTKSRKPHVT